MKRAPSRNLHVVRGSKTLVRFEAERGLNAVVLNAMDTPQRLKDISLSAAPSRESTTP